MAEEFKKTGLMDGMGENNDDDFKNDPEAGGNAKYRLPFALCKAKGIKIQDWWTPRDAWEALKSGGYVEDVDEEYAKRMKEEKREKDKKWREEHPWEVEMWRHRAKIKEAQLKDPEHNPNKNYIHEDGKIAGVAKGKPMTFEQADSGNVNPYFGTEKIGYRTNCQTCVATYVARKLGYDVKALPNLNNKNIHDLSYDVSLAYVDKDGKHPEKKLLLKDDVLLGVPENTTHALRWTWKGKRNGHIVVLANDGQGTYMYDPQNNKRMVGDRMRAYIANAVNFQKMDLTNCRLDEKFCDKIMNGAKKNEKTE